MTQEYKYKAFLSYSHKDKAWADWLHKELERYRVPPRLQHAANFDNPIPANLRPIFRDRDELSSGASLSRVINDALGSSEFLIVICSPAAVESEWVNEEIRTFQQLGRSDHILYLIVDGEPFAGGKEECFPQALRYPKDEHGNHLEQAEEPIAADVRGGKQERKHAALMLISGLLEIGLDELLQRDLHRRHRRLIAVSISASVIAFIMAGLMIFAFLAQAEAERRRADAENLVGFMLGDLREDLHAIGRIDVYGSVSEKAMDYFRSLGEDDARDEVLAQRAEALRQIGIAKHDQGDFDGAQMALNESLEIALDLAHKNPSRVDWNLALAESHFWVGYLHWQKGDLELAGKKFQEQLYVVDALAAAEPDSTERLANSGYAWTNYGRVLELSGNLSEAQTAYEKVMDIFQKLAAMQPENVDHIEEIGFAHNNLGKLKMSLGLLSEAESGFKNDLDIKQKIVAANPSHNGHREDLATSFYWYGNILQARGDLTTARQQVEQSIKIFDELLVTDPSRAPWRQRRVQALQLLSANCRMTKAHDCAADSNARALSDLEVLVEANAQNVGWQRSHSRAFLESAWQSALEDDLKSASEASEQALHIVNDLLIGKPNDRETRTLEALALLTSGDVAYLKGETESSQYRFWQSAREVLNTFFSESADPTILDLKLKLAIRLAYSTEAEELKKSLDLTGFHSPYPVIGPTG